MKDAIFCFTCIKAFEQSLISSKNAEKALISVEYKNWSNAATSEKSFHKHNRSEAHREAHQCIQVIPGQYEDIGEQISQPHAEEKSNNQQVLLKILSNVHFLARQLLPLPWDGDRSDSNFMDVPWKKWMIEKKNIIIRKTLKIMALQILREIAKIFKMQIFIPSSVTKQLTFLWNISQLVICMRWVDNEKRAPYTHCYTHFLNLAIGDTMKNSNLLKHTTDIKLVKKSPKLDAKFNKINHSLADEDSNETLFWCKQAT